LVNVTAEERKPQMNATLLGMQDTDIPLAHLARWRHLMNENDSIGCG